MAVLLRLELALLLGDVLDEHPVLVAADLLARHHGAVVGHAHLARDLAARRVRVDLLHRLLLQRAPLHRPLLALLLDLYGEKRSQSPVMMFIIYEEV